MKIATSTIRDFDKTIDGAATIVYNSDQAVTINSSSISERAFLFKRLPAIAGETITVKFLAKGNLGAAIDYPNVGGQSYKLEIDTENWREHKLSYTVPDDAVSTDFVQVAVGQYTGFQGEAKIANVRIEADSVLPTLRCYGAALLAINDGGAGNVSINENFTCIGFSRDAVNSAVAGTTLSLDLPGVSGGNNARSAPIFTANIDNFNSSTYNVDVRVGVYNRSTGNFTMTFIDTSTGNTIDVSTLGVFYVWIKAEGC